MSIITRRYEYNTYDKVEAGGTRKYKVGEMLLPSVTTVLDKTTDKSHLVKWKQRIGEAAAKEITQEASGIGTRMHKFLEDYISFGEWQLPGSNIYSKKANDMAKIIFDNAFYKIDEIWGQEVALYLPPLYAGTTDLICVYNGNPSICDYKQTNKPKKEEWVENYKMQLVAYAEAHNEVYKTSIREGHIFMCSRNLEYQQFDIWPDEYDKWASLWYDKLYKYWEMEIG